MFFVEGMGFLRFIYVAHTCSVSAILVSSVFPKSRYVFRCDEPEYLFASS